MFAAGAAGNSPSHNDPAPATDEPEVEDEDESRWVEILLIMLEAMREILAGGTERPASAQLDHAHVLMNEIRDLYIDQGIPASTDEAEGREMVYTLYHHLTADPGVLSEETRADFSEVLQQMYVELNGDLADLLARR